VKTRQARAISNADAFSSVQLEVIVMSESRKRNLKSLVLAASLSGLVAAPVWAADPVSIASDLVLMRPAGIAATAIGTGVFIASLPVTYATGVHRTAAEELVVKPYRFTVERPLGQ
jgi:hypothetical protein